MKIILESMHKVLKDLKKLAVLQRIISYCRTSIISLIFFVIGVLTQADVSRIRDQHLIFSLSNQFYFGISMVMQNLLIEYKLILSLKI